MQRSKKKEELERLAHQLMELRSAPDHDSAAPEDRPDAVSDGECPEGSNKGPASEEKTIEEIQSRLRTDGALTLGHVELLNLGEIRKKASKGSRLLLEGLEAITQRAIAKHLTEKDCFTKCNDDYLIAFSELDENQAKGRSDRIIRDVSEWLSGQEDASDARVESFVTRVSKCDLDGGGESLDSVVAVVTTTRLFNELRQEYERLEQTAATSRLPSNIEFRFRPIWNVRHKVISTFQCLPVWFNRNGNCLTGDHVLAGESDQELILELDLRILQEAGHALRVQRELGHTQLISVPVHFSTLNRQRLQQQFLSVLLAIPKDHRRFLVIEVFAFPDGVPNGRLLDVSLLLKDHIRASIFKTETGRLADLSIIAESKFLAVGIDLQGKAENERALMQTMDAFVQAANKNKLRTCVHGLSSLSLTTAAVCAGFDYIDGDAIAPLVETPDGLSALGPESLYKRFFRRC